MTDIGESVAVTMVTPENVEENHYAGFKICYPNGKPYQFPVSLDAQVDGCGYSGISNFEGQVIYGSLAPGASVEATIGEDVEAEITAQREAIKKVLDEIIAAERREQEALDGEYEKAGFWDKTLIVVGAVMTGVGDGVVGIFEFAGDTLETTGKVVWMGIQSQANLIETAWEKYSEGDIDGFYDTFEKKQVEDFANTFGTTPEKIIEALAEATKIFMFIMDDAETRDLLIKFAEDYIKAMAFTEKLELAGSAVFDIILGAILAFFTGGAGNAAQVAAKIKHADKFKSLAFQLIRYFKLSNKKMIHKPKVTGKLDELTEVKIELPPSKKVEVKEFDLKKKKENKQNKRDSDQEGDQQNSNETSGENSDSQADGKQSDSSTTEGGENKGGEKNPSSEKTKKGGEPISLVTGEEILELADFEIKNIIPISWTRTYRSSNRDNIGLGVGWSHPFAEHIEISDNKVKLHDAEGRIIPFTLPGVGYACENKTEKLSVYRETPTTFVVTSTDSPLALSRVYSAVIGNQKLHLTSIKDAFGHQLILQYGQNRLQAIQSQAQSWELNYHESGNIHSVVWHTSSGSKKELASYEYNDEDDLIQYTDSVGNHERYEFKNHLITKRTIKSGYNFYFQWDGDSQNARCIRNWGDQINGQATYDYRFKWDKKNRRVAMTDTRGGTELYQFNDKGLPVYHRDPEGGETHTWYDEAGNITKITDASGLSQAFYYDAENRLQTVLNKTGQKIHFVRDGKGNIIQTLDPQGQKWERTYNEAGLVSSQTNPLGEKIRYQYNSMGLLNTITDPLARSWHYIWDNHANLLAIKNPLGQHTRYSYNDTGELIKITWPDGQTTEYRYDDNGNCTAIKSPDGKVAQYAYTSLGLLSAHKDSGGRVTQYHYNGLSQVVKRTDPNGRALHYHYDGERNLIGLTNEKGEHYRLKYDLNERLIQEIGFDGRIQRYHYDKAGHLTSSEDYSRDGAQLLNHISYQRDIEGRLVKQIDELNGALLNEFSYDPVGRLASAQNKHRVLKWKYDGVGRVIEDWQDNNLIKHQYDGVGQRKSTQIPNGIQVDYRYDQTGAFVGMDYNGQTVTSIDRDAMGRELKRSLSNKLETEHRYDPQGRLVAQRTGKQDKDNNFKPVSQRRYHYNEFGQLSQIDDSIRGTKKYHYDSLDRLTKVEGPHPESFVHDPAGNILAAYDEKFAPEAPSKNQVQGNRLAFHGDTHYQYDELGNRTAQARGKNKTLHTHYRYNSLNQLVEVKHKNIDTQYHYDPLGRRILKNSAKSKTEFLWLEDVLLSEITQKHNEDAKQEKTYLFEPGTFKPLAFVKNNEFYHYHLDHLGTPQEITNANGKVVWAVSFKAYGNLAVAHANEEENHLRFQGQYFDEETGLHYNRFRYYDPQSGRFVNQDPIGLNGGPNCYQYLPNPIQWVDPFGLSKDCPETSRVHQDPNTTWDPADHPDVPEGQLPKFDGKHTLGKMDIDGETYYVKNGTGLPGQELRDNPAIKAGAVSPSHAEGHAIAIMRQTGTKEAVLDINHTGGPCGFCDKVLENMLPENSKLTVNWPGGSQTFVGNSK